MDPRSRSWRTLTAVAALTLVTSAATTTYTVRPGDTLSEIAARFSTSVRAMVEANSLRDPDRILAGTTLTVAAPAAAPSAAPGRTHVVGPGESLSTIAVRYGVSIADLAARNGLPDPDRVLAGSLLRIDGPVVTSTQWRCPVQGPVRFVSDFGYRKPGGRHHEGVDLFAARGAPVVANVAGRVEQLSGPRGGLQYRLHGDDGHLYIGTHMDSAGVSGRVAAGDVIGTVGTTGNARGTGPHLHFEFHPGGSAPADPYPGLVAACR